MSTNDPRERLILPTFREHGDWAICSAVQFSHLCRSDSMSASEGNVLAVARHLLAAWSLALRRPPGFRYTQTMEEKRRQRDPKQKEDLYPTCWHVVGRERLGQRLARQYQFHEELKCDGQGHPNKPNC